MDRAVEARVEAGDLSALTPIDRYLAEQGRLTAVERFAQRHPTAVRGDPARYYRDLVPLQRPATGQQYGFEVDLDACTGCKACVTACHRLNGLDEGESWRTVGVAHGVSASRPHQHTVTASCHHCIDPACLAGCPVNAYEKDPVTGVVAHLDDQCIGCRYCMLTCPYEVPRYNADRGIVRKCDLCAHRLDEGEAPACVQSCPNAAIRVGLVDVAAARSAAADGPLVAGAPASSITVPTTTYSSARPLDGGEEPCSLAAPSPGHAHPPLAVMLVLTQLAVGTSVVALVGRALAPPGLAAALRPATAVVAVAVGLLALAASVAHLGRPAYAYRAVLGWRRSWLSREIIAFGAFATLAAAHGWVLLVEPGGVAEALLGTMAAVAGGVGVACSVMVYAVTRRAWWSLPRTAAKFTLGSIALGAATVLLTSLVSGWAIGAPTLASARAEVAPGLAAVAAAAAAAKLAVEATMLLHLRRGDGVGPRLELRRSAQLLTGPLSPITRWRFASGAAAVTLALAVVLAAGAGTAATVSVFAGLSFAALLAGELAERSQFFTAAAPPRMPASPG